MRSANPIAFCHTSSFSKLNMFTPCSVFDLSTLNQQLSTLLIASLRQMHGFKIERLAMQYRRFSIDLKFPGKHRGVIFIVAQCFAFRGLVFFAKMRATGFIALQCIDTHQLGEFQKIGNTSGTFQRLIEIIAVPRHTYLVPELFAKFGNFFERLAQSLFVTRHSAFVPEKQAKLPMERIDRTSALDVEQFLDSGTNIFFTFPELLRIWRRPLSHLPREIIRQRVGQNKISISQEIGRAS